MARTTQRNIRTPRRSVKPAIKPVTLDAIRANASETLDLLVKRGTELRAQTRKLAMAKTQEARDAVLARADEARVRTVDAVSRLEKVFEDRVTGVIAKLGVPTARDVRELSRQVAHLQQSVEQLRRVRAR